MRRQTAHAIALILGLFVLGGLCGLAARRLGGLSAQQGQLERCVLTSKQSHPSPDARAALAQLDVEVPACMNAAGYETALNNRNCGAELWQGDVFCYVPRSYVGRLINRLQPETGVAADGARRQRLPSY